MPIAQLIQGLDPAPPREVTEAAEALLYRDFLIVALIVRTEDPFRTTGSTSTVHGEGRRIQNFAPGRRTWSPVAGHSSLGLEYFCSTRATTLWTSPSDEQF